MRLATTLLPLALLASACTPHPVQPTAQSSKAPSYRAVESPLLTKLLSEEGLTGTIALLRDGETQVECSNVSACEQRVVPASTFKIPNALIGLETGVIADADFVIPWDGVTRAFPEWNRDLDLRAAIKASAVPYFQELARRVGPQRMKHWVERLDFGNLQIGGEAQIDRFWLDGPLAISPVEQLLFLRRLARDELPVSARTSDIVRDILTLAAHDGSVLRGKTGWLFPDSAQQRGWFVGYAERGEQRVYVAVLLQPRAGQSRDEFLASRRRLAERALQETGIW